MGRRGWRGGASISRQNSGRDEIDYRGREGGGGRGVIFEESRRRGGGVA
jgi:hypothetical protein